jgi:hypothetical protein
MPRTCRRAPTVRSLSAAGGETGRRELPLPPTNTSVAAGPGQQDPAPPQPAGRAGAAARSWASARPGGFSERRGTGPGTPGVAGDGPEPARLHRGLRRRRLGGATPLPHRPRRRRFAGRSVATLLLPGDGVLRAAGPAVRAPLPGCGGMAQEAVGERSPGRFGSTRLPSLSTAWTGSCTCSPQASNRPVVNMLGSADVSRRTYCVQRLTRAARRGTVGGVESRPWGRSWRACSGASSSLPRAVRLAPRGA